MKKILKRMISVGLLIAFMTSIFPVVSSAADKSPDNVVSLGNGYITLNVSNKNGGFCVNTETGDKLTKSDDNKTLLYHNGEYDSSFTSFEIMDSNGNTKYYLFGGSYGFLGMSSSDVTVTKVNDSEIDAVWSVNDLTFTQKLMLVSSGANEHGMISIAYDVKNNGGKAVSVKARVLLDTALGGSDCGYYEVIDSHDDYRSIKTETVLTASDSIPQNFYAYDDPYNPTIAAYTVSKQEEIPYQAAFGHWNSLAATIFNFTPDATLNFTDPYNKYLTADSAYALYYDLGSISPSAGGSVLTYYGVYSHQDTPIKSSMAVDVSAPTSLSLNEGKTAYTPTVSQGIADFSVQAQMQNLTGTGAKTYNSITLAIYTASGIMPLNSKGENASNRTYDETDPYIISYADVGIGKKVIDTLYFSAKPAVTAEYRKVRLQIFDTSSSASLTAENLLGEKVFYILCPGTDGNMPKFTFTSLTPGTIYCSGTRHLFLTGTNIDILFTSIQNGNCTLKAYCMGGQSLTILKENVLQPEKNKLDIIIPDDIATGGWYLQLEWSDNAVNSHIVTPEFKKQTAPALSFSVSDDKAYKNDTYGVIAVVQTAKGADPAYRIRSFMNESAFNDFAKDTNNYVEILLVFRGEFEVKKSAYETAVSAYEPTLVTATSLKTSSDNKATNCISINNCMDFEDGVLTLQYASVNGGYGNIQVSFDGHLYTSDARTSIWKGEAAFTEIEQGKEFSLVSYDKDGGRDDKFIDNTINLVWPSVFGTAQTIAGMVFQLAYGQMGVMKDSDGSEVGRVVSFTAKLDLGFLIPNGKNDSEENTYWTRLKNFWKFYHEGKGGMYSYWAVENVDKIYDFSNEEKNENTGAASVMVNDILFGCGTGFVGVHFTVNVAIPNYVDGMPRVEGALEVNTIGSWSIGIDGKMKMATFTLEASLRLKSHNNIPVPDKIYFFVSGFEPGINIDGNGVIWITGGGGGLDNIYDTIFLSSGVPPLKLLLSVSFDILKVLSARTDLSLSFTGIAFTASDIKIKATNIVGVKKAQLEYKWYPDMYLMGAISVSLFDIIKGSGYMVLEGKDYSSWFFEAFVRAGVYIPDSIPVVGGMAVAQVDLGLNSQKIWGALKLLWVTLGVQYYWGGSVKFGSGDFAQPTYPKLLGCDDIPIYYDKEHDRTLYMRVGTNLSIAAKAEITDDFSNTPVLMGSSPALYSSGDRLSHRFNLGTRSGSNNALISINYTAASLEDAKNTAGQIAINDKSDKTGNNYTLTLYNGSNIDTANANVSYDSGTGNASLSFTVTDDSCYNKDWYFTTPLASEVVLYNVADVPEITTVSGSVSGTNLSAAWTGTQLNKLDSVKFYLVSDRNGTDDCGYPVTELTNSADIGSGAKTFAVPADVPAGDYYLRVIYSQDGVVNSSINSAGTVAVTNAKTPAAPIIKSVSPAGDLKLGIGIDNPTADAYIVNVYKYDSGTGTWVSSDVNGMLVNKSGLVNNVMTVGGSYTYTDDSNKTSVKGLQAGVDYRIGITACNYIDSDSNGENDTAVYGNERFYSSSGTLDCINSATSVTLPEANPPKLTVSADKTYVSLSRTVGNMTESFDTYASSSINFTVSADKAMTGTWTLDGKDGLSGTVTGTSASIPLTGLSDGDHTLLITGTGSNGDGFRYTYSFTVDTVAPRLLLSSPTNGSFFNENGTLTVTGITDAGALFSLDCDGSAAVTSKSISELKGKLNADGVFSFTVPLPNADSASKHEVAITVSDAVGNSTAQKAEVCHGGLSDIKKVEVYADGVKWTNSNITSNPLSDKVCHLSLCATTNSGVSFFLTDEKLVRWNFSTVNGTANVTNDGTLTINKGAVGYAAGSLLVADNHALTSAITFGSESYGSTSSYSVVTGSTSGGTVTSGGVYSPGETVTLTATPDSGCYFSGWKLDGVGVADTSARVITFTMPNGNVVAAANFGVYSSSTGTAAELKIIAAKAGQKLSCKIPAGADANRYVPYYLIDSQRVYVPMSTVKNGALTFIAPAAGTYYMEERAVSFNDTGSHWAKSYIDSAAARGLFNGIGDGKFNPDGKLTRAMFVTVLWRLAGSPTSGTSSFNDVADSAYYAKATAWAQSTGIVQGYENGLFGSDYNVTREQICAFISRYMNYAGVKAASGTSLPSFADSDKISSWAAQAVDTCRGCGIINGEENNIFAPSGDATRAESCAIFCRLIPVIIDSVS